MAGPELNFIQEDIPAKPKRIGGAGRAAIAWEDLLQPVKDGSPKSYRVWDYEKPGGAASRKSTVQTRLRTARPGEKWNVVTRPTPDAPEGHTSVYVAMEGFYTPEEIAENEAKHKALSDRIRRSQKAAREAKEQATPEPVAKRTGNGKTKAA